MNHLVVLTYVSCTVLVACSDAQQPAGGSGINALDDFQTKRVTLMLHDHCKASVVEVVESKAPTSKFVPLVHPAQKLRDPTQRQHKKDRRVPHHFHNWTTKHGFDAQDHGMEGLSAEGRQFRYLLTFEAGVTGPQDVQEVGHMFIDPRIRFADGILGDHPRNEEERFSTARQRVEGEDHTKPAAASFFFHEPGDAEFIWVPYFVDTVTLYCHNFSAPQKMDVSRGKRTPTPSHHHSFHDVNNIDNVNRKEVERGMKPQLRAAADASYINQKVLQSTGPVHSQPNIIFISGGFTKAQEEDFDATVARIQALLEDPISSSGAYAQDPDVLSEAGAVYKVPNSAELKNQHASVPFDRYWPLFNVFSVFQESPEAGSSYPKSGIKVNDNLDCYHPAAAERGVSCTVSKSVALASASAAEVANYPDKAIIIVVVNTFTYGGTGIFRSGRLHLCHFFKGVEKLGGAATVYEDAKYASLINHELGHAFGNLFDEYDIGFSEPTTVPLANCQAGNDFGAPNPPQWSDWVTLANVNDQSATYKKYRGRVTSDLWGVTTTPTMPCGFSNYFKPNKDCMMGAVNDYYMCPVCREQATKTIMGGQAMEYQWPRFPLPDPVLLILDDNSTSANGTTGYATVSTGIAFHLPKILGAGNEFSVIWSFKGTVLTAGPVGTADCPACFTLTPAIIAQHWTSGDYATVHDFYANVTDNTIFIAPNTKASIPGLQQSYKFSWRVVTPTMLTGGQMANVTVNPPVAAKNTPFGRSNLDTLKTYQQCLSTPETPHPLCNLTFTDKQYESPADLDALLAAYDEWVLYAMGGLAFLLVLLWMFGIFYYSSRSHDVVRPIFRVEFKGCVRVIRAIMRAAAILFMLATLGTMGFSAWFYLNSSALGRVAVALGMVVALGLYVMAFIGFWAVSYRSKKLVIANGVVLVFGLLVLLTAAGIAISVGETIRDHGSYWSQELETYWKDTVKNDPGQACAIQGVLACSGYIVPCNGIVESTVYCPIHCEKTNERYATSCKKVLEDHVHDTYGYVLGAIFGCIVLMGVAIGFNAYYYYTLRWMKLRLRKILQQRLERHAAEHGTPKKHIDKKKALHILKTLDVSDHTKLIREFRRIDTDGNEELDRTELTDFFKKAFLYKPRPEEIDEIFSVADVDHSGTISLEEFLHIFDPSAVLQLDSPDARPKQAQSRLGRLVSRRSFKRKATPSNAPMGDDADREPSVAMQRRNLTDHRRDEIQRRSALVLRGTYSELEPIPTDATVVHPFAVPTTADSPTFGPTAESVELSPLSPNKTAEVSYN